MNVETDKDIYRYVKNIMRTFRFDNTLDIYLMAGVNESYRFNIDNIDELAVKMFDFSMSKRVSEIHSFGSNYCSVSAFGISISESTDHQTNITSRMIDFFKLIVDQFSRDTLVEALKPPKQEPMENYLNWGDGRFIIAPMVETNPWDYFEQDVYD